MGAQRSWWNRRWGGITRRDVLICHTPEHWLVEAREGGPDCRSKRVTAASEAEALQIAQRFRELGGDEWKEMTTATVYPRVLDELLPAVWHRVEQYANNRIEADHSRPKYRLRPMRGLRTDRIATVIIAGLALMQNLRRGHYELATETPRPIRVATALTKHAQVI